MTFLVVASRIFAYSRTLADMMVFVSIVCTEEISTLDEVEVSQEVCHCLPVLSNNLYLCSLLQRATLLGICSREPFM